MIFEKNRTIECKNHLLFRPALSQNGVGPLPGKPVRTTDPSGNIIPVVLSAKFDNKRTCLCIDSITIQVYGVTVYNIKRAEWGNKTPFKDVKKSIRRIVDFRSNGARRYINDGDR